MEESKTSPFSLTDKKKKEKKTERKKEDSAVFFPCP